MRRTLTWAIPPNSERGGNETSNLQYHTADSSDSTFFRELEQDALIFLENVPLVMCEVTSQCRPNAHAHQDRATDNQGTCVVHYAKKTQVIPPSCAFVYPLRSASFRAISRMVVVTTRCSILIFRPVCTAGIFNGLFMSDTVSNSFSRNFTKCRAFLVKPDLNLIALSR